MAKARSNRYPLLVYTNLWRRWGRLGLLLALVSAALWALAPRILGPTPLRHLAIFPILAGGLLFLYGLVSLRMAYVQCFSSYLRIRTPIYPLVISYRRILVTRPMQLGKIFDPKTREAGAARRVWPLRYWTMTAIVVETKGFPVSTWWLRLWFDRYMFAPGTAGFVLLVEDWMGFSRQLDGLLSTYRARRAG
jgi:hypothetical protein